MFGQNRFTSIPNWICSFRSLRVLAVDGNYLEGLPEEIGTLSNLEKLNIAGNSIIELPETLLMLPKLKLLWVDSKVLSRRSSELLDKLRDNGVTVTLPGEFFV